MKATTLEDALLNTLLVRKRLPRARLVFFAQLRFERDTKTRRPAVKNVEATLSALVKNGSIVRTPRGSFELGAQKGATLERAKKRAAAKKAKKPKRPPPPKNCCYFPATSENAFAAAKGAIAKRFEVFESTVDAIAFRWRHAMSAGPMFRLMPSDRAAAKRSMRAWQRSAIARHEPPFVAFLALSFDSLDEVLDEANGLIEAQHVVTTATRGPMFLTWNKSFIDGNDDPVPRVSSRRSRTSARP